MWLIVVVVAVLSKEVLSAEIFVCENKVQTITCSASQILKINYANFGRTSKLNCPNPRYDQNTQCRTSNSTAIVRQNCEGKQSCTVSASIQVFGDPCYGIYKYLEVNYACVGATPSKPQEVIGCPHTDINIQCPGSTVIQVTSADYGRHSKSACTGYPDPNAFQNTQCSYDVTNLLQQSCTGRQSCTWNVDSTTTYDPCVGTYKYVTVNYICIAPGEVREQIGCPHTDLTISCLAGTIIDITFADYGRHSTTYCPYIEDSGAMRNTTCSLDETAQLRQACNGRQTCTWNVDSTSSFDPCVGTYKYVTAQYTCNPPGIKCGANEVFGCDDLCIRQCQPAAYCRSTCLQGCICRDGFKRDSITGTCVPEKYCPVVSSGGKHEVFTDCDASCQATCSNPNPYCAGAPCVPGYVCAGNFVRDTVTGQCINYQKCGKRPF